MKIIKSLLLLTAMLLLLTSCEESTEPEETQTPRESYLIFTDDQTPAVIIGQEENNISTADNAYSAHDLSDPTGKVSVVNNHLFIPDSGYHRVVIHDTIPTEINASATGVLGPDTLTSGTNNDLHAVKGVYEAEGKFFVVDGVNHRILIYNEIPYSGNVSPDVIIGQENNLTKGPGCAANKLNVPRDVIVANGKLFIADTDNSRILIYNSIPTENNASADYVVGQASFTNCAGNDKNQNGIADGLGLDGRTMSLPNSVWSDGIRLVVADTFNLRILIWSTFPEGNFTSADLVLGQSDFASSSANGGLGTESPSPIGFWFPKSIFVHENQLFLADYQNHRVLIWNEFPDVNNTPADIVLGQADMYSQDNNLSVSPNRMSRPSGVFVKDKQLFVTDSSNDRVLIFNAQ